MLQIKFIILITLAIVTIVNGSAICAGCPSSMKAGEAKAVLNNSLYSLSRLDGPYYKIAKINSATKQVVAGGLYKINADLLDNDETTKSCSIEIWSRPWLENGMQVTFKCSGETDVVKKYSAQR